MAEIKRSSLFSNWECMLACLLISMSPFQYGIDFSMVGGFQAMKGFLKIFGYVDPDTPVGYNISTEVQQLISSLMTLGSCLGSVTAGPIGGYIGRRPSLWIACLLCAVSDAIMLGTTNIGTLYAGRLLIGIANGWFMTFSQLYLQECAPAQFRGVAFACFQWWCTLGSLIGSIVNNFTSESIGRDSYMIPLAVIYVVPAILTVGMFFIPESPRWLLQNGQPEEARKSLTWLRPDKETVDAEMAQMTAALEAEQLYGSSVGFWDMFRDHVDRRRTLLSIAAICIQGASGALFVISYSTYFFEMANVGMPFADSCMLGAVGVVAITISGYLITRIGRRTLLMTGITVSGLCLLIIAVIYQTAPGTENTGRVIVGFTLVYMVFYDGCVCPFAWLVGGEIPSQRLCSMTLGLSSCIGFLLGWVAVFTAPYFINPDALNWGPKYGYIWFPSCMVTAIFIFLCLPETKDRTLEELDERFAARLSSRKFAGYVCTGIEKNRSDVENSSTDEKTDEGAVDPVDYVDQVKRVLAGSE